MWLALGFYRHEIPLASEGFCFHANLDSRAAETQVSDRHTIDSILLIDILEWERGFYWLCYRNRIPDWLAIPLVVTPKLGHILFVTIDGNKPVSVCIIDDLHVDALDDDVSSIARKRQILSVSAEHDRRVEASPDVLCV